MRRWYRFVTLAILLSMLLTLVPATTLARTSAATYSPSQQQQALPLSQTQAGSPGQSTGLTPTDLPTYRDETQHTFNGLFDGSFKTVRRQTYTAAGPYQLSGVGNTPVETIITIPAGKHDAVVLDVDFAVDRYSGSMTLYARQSGFAAGEWTNISTYTAPSSSGAANYSATNIEFSLIGPWLYNAPIELKLGCKGGNPGPMYDDNNWNCTWKNLRFYTNAPGWKLNYWEERSTAQGPELVNIFFWQTRNTAYTTRYNFTLPVSPKAPYLALESNSTHSMAPNQHIRLKSAIIVLPQYALTDKLQIDLRWAQSQVYNNATSTGFQVLFEPLNETAETILTVSGVAGAQSWKKTDKEQATFPAHLAGKAGHLIIKKTIGSAPHATGIDEIVFYMNGQPIAIPFDQGGGKCVCDAAGNVQYHQGDPVNTYSGAFYLQTVDMSMPSSGPELTLERTYLSLFADPDKVPATPLGSGWTHSFAESLTIHPTASVAFGTNPPVGATVPIGAEELTIIWESASGNRYRFVRQADNSFLPAPGVRASLKQEVDGKYTLTTSTGHVKIFGSGGKLREVRDPLGHTLTLTYFTANNESFLDLVTDDTTGRGLKFTYTLKPNGKHMLTGVNEQFSTLVDPQQTLPKRAITYTYQPFTVNGQQIELLVSASSLNGGVTTYAYDSYTGQTQLLKSITDPAGTRQVLNEAYDAERRVLRQRDARDLITTFDYVDGPNTFAGITGRTTTVKLTKNGVVRDVRVDFYRPDGTLMYQEQGGYLLGYSTFDESLGMSYFVDGNGRKTTIKNNADGMPIEVTDASGRTVKTTYNANNQPTRIERPGGMVTTMIYNAAGNLTSQTTTGADGLEEVHSFVYNTANQLTSETGPDGVVTAYTYYTTGHQNGMLYTVTRGQGTPQAIRTLYYYDHRNWVTALVVKRVGATEERRTEISYYDSGKIKQIIRNVQDGQSQPGEVDVDIITRYGYDQRGNLIWTRDPSGAYHLNHYDEDGYLDWSLQNYAQALEVDGALSNYPSALPAFDPTKPDLNVSTTYGYDDTNRMNTMVEHGLLSGPFDKAQRQFNQASTRTTLVEYDDVWDSTQSLFRTRNRPSKTTLNYKPGQPSTSDQNIVITTAYDGVDNLIWQNDPLNNWTKLDYNADNNLIKTIYNWVDGDPKTTGVQEKDTDLVITTTYDLNFPERTIETIENRIDDIFVINAPGQDRITAFGYDGLGRPTKTVKNVLAGSTTKDTNIVTLLEYNAQGRVGGERDPLLRWKHIQYDTLGNPNKITVNCRNSSGTAVSSSCAAFNAARPDENLVYSILYDDFENPYQITNPLGIKTYSTYDKLDRVTSTTQNYIAGGAVDAETNVKSQQFYDVMGNVVKTIDPMGRVTLYTYDKLGNVTKVQEQIPDAVAPMQPVRETLFGYDGHGTLRWSMTPDGRLTVNELDGLDRVTKTIQNYDDGVNASAGDPNADPTDRDMITRTMYDAKGRATKVFNPGGGITSYGYDKLDHLVTVVENDQLVCAAEATDCGVLTEYTYDRFGNRTSIVTRTTRSGATRTRLLTYDAADRVKTEVDALNKTTTWEYDKQGNVTKRVDPRGASYNLVYTYDGVDRLTKLATEAGSTTPIAVDATYDALGRRLSLTDATGTTSFVYDKLDRMKTATQPNTNPVGYQYNAAGERTRLTYPNGQQINYDYYADGNLKYVKEGASTLASYSYDPSGRLKGVARSNNNSTSYSYDDADRLKQIQHLGALNSTYTYTFKRTGEPETLTELHTPTTDNLLSNASFEQDADGDDYPDQWPRIYAPRSPVAYTNRKTYNPADGNYILELTGDSTNPSYALGQWLSIIGGRSYQFDGKISINGTADAFTIQFEVSWYNTSGGLISTSILQSFSTTVGYMSWADMHAEVTAPADAVRAYFTIRAISIKDPIKIDKLSFKTTGEALPSSGTTSYAYDGLGRLTGAVEALGSGTTSYDYKYDMAGNRTEAKINGAVVGSWQYNAADQVIGWSYDNAGNLLSDGSSTYTYNPLNQLTKVVKDGVTTGYTYNGDGTLVKQGTTTFVQDHASPLSQILSSSDSGNQIYGHERLASGGSSKMWYFADGLGNVRHTINDAGGLQITRYDPWGNPTAGSPTPFGFTGERHDASGDLVYLRARWYDTNSGRFLSRDPFPGWGGLPASQHPYQYAYNSPTRYTDPSGMCISWVWGSGQCEFAGANPYNWNWQDGGLYLKGIRDAAVDEFRGTVSGIYTLLTDPQAQAAAWESAKYYATHPWELPGVVAEGIVSPFRNMYYAMICDDPYMMGRAAYDIASTTGATGLAGKFAFKAARRAWKGMRHMPDMPNHVPSHARGGDFDLSGGGGSCLTQRNSFSADTVVQTAEGEVPIVEIEIGDLVLAYDEATGATGYYTVTDVISHVDPSIIHLTIDGELIETTAEHPFYTWQRGWVEAGELQPGDWVYNTEQSYGAVEAVEVVQREQRMYNLTVAIAHTFFVGDGEWLVHNINPNGCSGGAPALIGDDYHPLKVEERRNNARLLWGPQETASIIPSVVRRFTSRSGLKQARKSGIKYIPKDHGIPTTTINIKPRHPERIKQLTGAVHADYYMDINIKGKPVLVRDTGGGLPEYAIQDDIHPEDIIDWGPVDN